MTCYVVGITRVFEEHVPTCIRLDMLLCVNRDVVQMVATYDEAHKFRHIAVNDVREQ